MSWLKRSMLVGATAAVMLGCTQPSAGRPTSSGSLAISQDEQFLYAADTDNGIVAVVDATTMATVARVQVGAAPVRVLVGADDTIYVANRGDDSVSVIRKGDWQEAARLKVGVEPTGLALSPDSKQLYVTSSTARDSVESGTLTAIDTATLTTRWELPVGQEPRGVTVIDHGKRALVSLFKQGEVVEVDLTAAKVKASGAGIYDAANASRSATQGNFSTFQARAINDLVAVPDGTRVFAPVVWAREDAIARRPSASGGYYSAGGPCNVGAVATPGLVTLDTRGAPEARVDDLTACSTGAVNNPNVDYPVTSLVGRAVGTVAPEAIQGPTVGVVDPSGEWLYLVNRESKNLAVIPAYRRTGDDLSFTTTGSSVRSLVPVGAGADGVALSGDGLRAYVYSQFDHRIDTLEAADKTPSAPLVVRPEKAAVVAGDTLSADAVEGRKLFFDAVDPRMSNAATNVACSTCHLEGREDGHVWQFPDGPRQTPALAGRHLLATAPYHWSGEFKTLQAFSAHTIVERMGGSGLDDATAAKLDGYIDSLPAAPSPIAATDPAAVRGKAVFAKAACGTCHTGALLTDNQNADVGSLSLLGTNRDNGLVVTNGFNVPSLLGLGRSAPYLHDGSAPSLEARVYAANPGDKHGLTSTLTQGEKDDLVTYLKSL